MIARARRPVAVVRRRRAMPRVTLATIASAVVMHAAHLVALAAGPAAIAGAVGIICHIR